MVDKSGIAEAINDPLNFVLYFEEDGFLKPHYYIILPTNSSDEFVILTMITSQIEKIKTRYRNNENALSSLMYIDGGDLSFLLKSSVINCNSPRKVTIDEILQMDKLRVEKACIPARIIRDIARKINASKAPKPNLKKSIDLSRL